MSKKTKKTSRKISQSDVNKIRVEYLKGNMTQTEIASKWKTSVGSINNILNNKSPFFCQVYQDVLNEQEESLSGFLGSVLGIDLDDKRSEFYDFVEKTYSKMGGKTTRSAIRQAFYKRNK